MGRPGVVTKEIEQHTTSGGVFVDPQLVKNALVTTPFTTVHSFTAGLGPPLYLPTPKPRELEVTVTDEAGPVLLSDNPLTKPSTALFPFRTSIKLKLKTTGAADTGWQKMDTRVAIIKYKRGRFMAAFSAKDTKFI
jgi:hypothetical protein